VNCGEKTSALVYEYILAMRTAMLFPDSRNNVEAEILPERYVVLQYIQGDALKFLL